MKDKQTATQKMQEKILHAQQGHTQVQGDHLYIFENHKSHDLSLPRKSYDGKTLIPPRGRFKGDEYFLMLQKTGMVRLVSSEPYIRKPAPVAAQAAPVAAPPAPEQPKPLNEAQENQMEKLILDQPEKFTARGHSEAVNVNSQPQVENCKTAQENANAGNKNRDVLLTENPLEGIDIITG